MDAAEIVNKAAADLAPMTVKDYLDDIGEFLDDAEHFELADDSTVDITPALNGLRAVEAQIESDAKVIAALRAALEHADYVLMRYASHQMGTHETYKAFHAARDRIKSVLAPTNEQNVGKGDG